MLRNNSDLRSVIFMIVTTALLVALWLWSERMHLITFCLLYAAMLGMAVVVSTITHNHQHLTMWKNRWMNRLTDNWLTVFYGFPVFAWIPTHNFNHHKYINKAEDYTKTYRYSEKNNLLTLLSYPSISGYFQQKVVFRYLVSLWSGHRTRFYLSCLQVGILLLWVTVAVLVDWKKAVLFVIIPQQLSLFTVLVFNYIQHVHADEESSIDNSRNFTGSVLNFFLLNNGFHTAHHESPGLHWSRLKSRHRELAPAINPVLNEKNIGWYFFRNYLLGIFIPSCRTRSLRTHVAPEG